MFAKTAGKSSAYVRYGKATNSSAHEALITALTRSTAEISAGSRGVRRQNWTPFAARLPFLISFALLLLLCVASLEVLVRQTKPYVTPEPESESDAEVSKRQNQAQVVTAISRPVAKLKARVEPTTTKVQSIISNRSSYIQLSTTAQHAAAAPTTTAVHAAPPSSSKVDTIVPQKSSYLVLSSTTVPQPAKALTTTPIAAPTITIEKSSYLSLSSTKSPEREKTTPPTTTPYVAPTIVKDKSSYLDLSSTKSPEREKTTPPTTTPYVAPTIVKDKSSYLDLSSTKSPEPEKAMQPTTTPQTVAPTVVKDKSSYLSLSSTKSPEPEKAPLTTTTPQTVAPTVVKDKSSYLSLSSTQSPQPEKAPLTTTTPQTVAPTVVKDKSSYLSLSSTQSPDGAKAMPTTTPQTPIVSGTSSYIVLTSKSSYLDLSSTQSPERAKGAPSTTTPPTVAPTVVKDKSSYLDLSSTQSPELMKGSSNAGASTTTAASNRNQGSSLGNDATLTITKTTGYLQLGSSTSPGANKNPSSSTGSEPALTKTSGYLVLGSSTSQKRPDSTLDSSAAMNLKSSGTVRALSTSAGESPLSTPRTGTVTKSTASGVTKDGTTKTDGTRTDSTKTGGTKTGTSKYTGTATERNKNFETGTSTSGSTASTPAPTSFGQVITNLVQPNREVQGQFTPFWYFLAIYFPSLVAVLLKEIWAAVAAGLKMMEPFYQLNQPEGASARNSLMSDYLSSTVSIPTFASAFRGNGLMIVILMGNSIMYLLAPLATESMTVVSTLSLRDDEGRLIGRMNPAWVLTLPLIRFLQATMSFVAFLLVIAIVIRWKHRSGLSANPSKIATMASLLNHTNVVQGLNNIDANAPDQQIARSIAHERYMITNHVDRYGNNACGLVKLGDIVPHGVHQLPQDDATNPMLGAWPQPPNQPTYHREESRTMGRIIDGIALFVLVGLFAVLIAFWVDSSDSGFNLFFISGKFGPRFVMSLAASIATAAFQSFEREVRLLLPYRRLAARQAPARNTVLRSVNGTAASTLWQSIRHGTWYHFLIAFITVLGNVLIVTAAGTPYTSSQVYQALLVNISVSIAITVFMIFAILSVFFWRRKNKKMNLPREPNLNLLRVWMSLSNKNNKLRSALNDSDDVDSSALRARLRQDGGLYWAGWVQDEHGRERWTVDREMDGRPGGYSDRLP